MSGPPQAVLFHGAFAGIFWWLVSEYVNSSDDHLSISAPGWTRTDHQHLAYTTQNSTLTEAQGV